MKDRLILFALLLASAAMGQQGNTPLGARLKMHWKGDTVSFLEAGQTHDVSIKEQFQAVQLEKVILQSAKESNGFIYLLLDVTGPSKLPRDSHQCGAGNESNLIWLKLDKSWKQVDVKTFLYDSCWTDSAAMIDPPKWTGDTLKVTTVNKVATYSYRTPDEGLKIKDDVVK